MIWRAGLTAFAILIPVTAFAGDGTFGVPPSGILLPPPPQHRTAALIPPERAAPEKQRPVPRVQQTYQPAPAEGAGRSRALPPSEAPVHSPVIAPPKHKRFKAPTASVDPDYLDSVAQGQPRSLSAPAAEPAPVVAQGAAPEQKRGLFNMLRGRGASQPQVAQAQGAPMQLTPAYATAGTSAASAAHAEYAARPVQSAYALAPAQPAAVATAAPAQPAAIATAAPPPSRTASLFSFGGSKPGARARDGTPCSQLRGLFTSPPECR